MAGVTIDRIEEGVAVLVYRGAPFELPVELLPEGAREGDALELSLVKDEAATRAARAAITEKRERLSKDDDGGDFSL